MNNCYIVIIDMRSNNGQIVVMTNEEDVPAQFQSINKVRKCMKDHPMNEFPWYIMDMNTGKIV